MQELSRQKRNAKKALARKNYEEFIKKMNLKTLAETPTKLTVEIISVTQDKKKLHDYYFTDNPLTPTSVLEYIDKNNLATVKRTGWIKEIWFKQKDYERLLSMIDNPIEPIIIRDVKIISLNEE